MYRKFISDTQGTTALEYGLIFSVVFGAAVPMIRRYGTAVETNLYEILEAISRLI